MIRHIAQIMKSLIEEKEFFLYPFKEIKDIFDIVLHKQIWFRHFFLDFIYEDVFLKKSLEEQKDIMWDQYTSIKSKNKFNKLFFYKIIVTNENNKEHIYNQICELFEWINIKKIRTHILILNWKTGEVFSIFKNFPDFENIEIFLSQSSNTPQEFEMQEINFLEIERTTKEKKGYVFHFKKTYFTYIFAAINILVFLFISMQGGTTNIYNLIRFGAKYNPLIAAGEYYRLITNIFIHIGIVHLLLNTYALKILGRDIEYIFGSFKFVFIYLISGLCGSLGSFIFSKAVSAGASGAIFGLMGAYLYFGVRKPAIFSSRYGINIVSLLVINIIFGLLNPSIDNFAHLGGLIGGFIVSCSLGLKSERIIKIKHLKFQLCTILMIAALFFWGMTINQQSWQYHLHKGIQYLQQNNFHSAQTEFERGIKKKSDVAEFYFYLGYIRYQQGSIEDAIYYFKKTLDLNPNDSMAKDFLNEIQQNK